ncbi:DUF2294 domain-containing protein [Leptolyngbya sp. FACHB-17]|uniref:DUF2294 domain-containing protein n=1 Tax=unclassified Leptolyngbya TaxID=2650499 RepID=UPI0016819718|nr:DUF2294 domain-containing protein [Leptolyngbya sp. FACHB-17]MBD2078767.1 DUF2294 domain-containing protein [Leptolyngbya sp. FACHB-17]
MTNDNPTRGQIERTIGQKLQALYRERTGQRPEKVTCQFFDEKLAIVLEQISTPAECFLIEVGQQEIAQLFRSELENQMKAETIALIEEVAAAAVVDVLSSTNLQAGVSALIAILKEPPSVRDPESIPKSKRRNDTERSPEEAPE